MFSKKNRINREKIGFILKKPDFSFNSENFILKSSKNKLPHPRFTIVLSKKIEKSAVSRHFLKRKISKIIKEINLKINLDFVFIFKSNLKNKKESDLKNEIEKILNKCIID